MEKESEIKTITRFSRIHYDTYASLPTTNLRVGEAGFATDRKVLYRWSGIAWESIGISSRYGNYAAIGDPAHYPESSLYQAVDQDLLYMVVSGAWVKVVRDPFPPDFAVGNIIAVAAGGEVSTQSESCVKVKEILVATGGTIRVYFELKSSSGSSYTIGRIYKNGVAFGTNRQTNETSWQTFSEDLVFAQGDLVQIYLCVQSATYHAYCRSFQLKAAQYHSHAVVLD